MLNEPATTPKKPAAKLIFGVLTGVLTMLFRYYGSYEIGGCFAILLVNATEGYWDRLFSGQKNEKAPKAEKQTVEIKKPAAAEELKQLVQEARPDIEEIEIYYVTPAVGAHVGCGVAGIAAYKL